MVTIPSSITKPLYSPPRSKTVNDLMEKSSEAKTFESWIKVKIKLSYENKDKETEIILKSILEKFKDFQKTKEIITEGWNGKSGIIELIKYPDKIIAVKMQKPDKESEPKEVRYEISKEQLNALILAINKYQNNQPIKTQLIESEWCRLLGYDRNSKGMPLFWKGKFMEDNFFAWRKMHNLITVALGILDHEGHIEYIGGKTKILNEYLSVKSILIS